LGLSYLRSLGIDLAHRTAADTSTMPELPSPRAHSALVSCCTAKATLVLSPRRLATYDQSRG